MDASSSSNSVQRAPREFPPLYRSQGNPVADRLAFFHILERLKTQQRTGWVDDGLPNVESISDHMYRMAVMAMCTTDATLDIAKCVMLAVVHDIAEAQVGDITPHEGISREEKIRLERANILQEAMENFIHEMLHNSPAAQRIMALWEEYEAKETAEARFVKDLDRFEMALQALEYERVHDRDLQLYFDDSLPYVQHPEVQRWGADLLSERTAFRASKK